MRHRKEDGSLRRYICGDRLPGEVMIREMHKTLDLLSRNKHNYMSSGDYDLQKHDIEEGKKNIIFLDIDGVIQPYHLAERFNHDLDQLIDYLCDKYEDPIYKEMDKYDVGAAF